MQVVRGWVHARSTTNVGDLILLRINIVNNINSPLTKLDKEKKSSSFIALDDIFRAL